MQDTNSKRVLIVAPHMDDEVLGCGGAILRHLERGDNVFVCFVANRVYSHALDEAKAAEQVAHARKAQDFLGYGETHFCGLPDEQLDASLQRLIIAIEGYAGQVRPDVVYSPFPYDNNQDHRAVAQAVQVVLRPCGPLRPERWLFYEVPSSTEQAPNVGTPVFRPTVYVDVEPYLERKIGAFACYEDEGRPYPNPRSPEGLRAMAMRRGMEAGMKYAEAYMLVRERVG